MGTFTVLNNSQKKVLIKFEARGTIPKRETSTSISGARNIDLLPRSVLQNEFSLKGKSGPNTVGVSAFVSQAALVRTTCCK